MCMCVSLARPGYLLIICKAIEELIDVTDAEKSRGIQVRQDLDQDLRWHSTKKVIRHDKEVTQMFSCHLLFCQHFIGGTRE